MEGWARRVVRMWEPWGGGLEVLGVVGKVRGARCWEDGRVHGEYVRRGR